jgi:predicted ATPase
LPVWLAYARVLHGWTLAQSSRIEDGISEMSTGLVQFEDALHMGYMRSFLLSLLGEGYGKQGRLEEGLAKLDAAISFAEVTGEVFWYAEALRLRGELLLHHNGPSSAKRQEAEACFLKAREIASKQGAKALELRAAMSLCRLWQRDKPADARRLLEEVHNGFTEGFDSPELLEARRLLSQFQLI